MGEESITISELIILQLYLGSPVYLIAIVIELFYAHKISHVRLANVRTIVIISSCFIVSILLSLVVWHIWPIKFDIMIFQFINIPCVVAQIFVLPIALWLFKKGVRVA